MPKNPFGDATGPERKNPFGEDNAEDGAIEPVVRIEQAARKIRALRAQLGTDGLTFSASRDLIDEVSAGLEAAARALRGQGRDG
jgi:hypothetical protein